MKQFLEEKTMETYGMKMQRERFESLMIMFGDVKKLMWDIKNQSYQITTADGKTFLIANPSRMPDGWFLYDGCELVTGDRLLNDIANVFTTAFQNNEPVKP
jgi:hypothetical protein